MPDQLLVTEMRKIEGERDPTKIQGVANSIAWMARSLAFDGAFMSPFAQSAQQNGIDAIGNRLRRIKGTFNSRLLRHH